MVSLTDQEREEQESPRPSDLLSRDWWRRLVPYWSTLGLVYLVILVLSISLGAVRIPWVQIVLCLLGRLPCLHFLEEGIPPEVKDIILQIRLPRVLLASLAGVGLSIAGGGLQGLFGNPLADPFILGVSAGSAVGVALVFLFKAEAALGGLSLPLAGFITAMLTLLLVVLLARIAGRSLSQSLLLAGIVLGSSLWSLVSLLLLVSGQDLQQVFYWLLGSFSGADYHRVLFILPSTLVSFLGLWGLSRDLNLLTLGEETALYLGVNLRWVQRGVLLFSTMATAGAVATSGIIGFVGLITPHLTRMIVGPDHRLLIPCSALMGGSLLLLADLVARTLMAPSELPVGLVTSLIGGPFFFYLLKKQS